MSIIFADTDENAFEARDLENDFHDMSTTKDPISSHGMYIYNLILKSSNIFVKNIYVLISIVFFAKN